MSVKTSFIFLYKQTACFSETNCMFRNAPELHGALGAYNTIPNIIIWLYVELKEISAKMKAIISIIDVWSDRKATYNNSLERLERVIYITFEHKYSSRNCKRQQQQMAQYFLCQVILN